MHNRPDPVPDGTDVLSRCTLLSRKSTLGIHPPSRDCSIQLRLRLCAFAPLRQKPERLAG